MIAAAAPEPRTWPRGTPLDLKRKPVLLTTLIKRLVQVGRVSIEYELDLKGTGQDSRVANLSVQKRVPPRLDCRDEDEAEDADHE